MTQIWNNYLQDYNQVLWYLSTMKKLYTPLNMEFKTEIFLLIPGHQPIEFREDEIQYKVTVYLREQVRKDKQE